LGYFNKVVQGVFQVYAVKHNHLHPVVAAEAISGGARVAVRNLPLAIQNFHNSFFQKMAIMAAAVFI